MTSPTGGTPPPSGPAPSGPVSSTRTPSGFALTGPSVALDPAIHAVRPDLADVRLAGQVFAPHFAAALPYRATGPVAVTAARDGGAEVARLDGGDRFDVLEVAGDRAWGIATGAGRVGYVDRHALEPVA